MRFILDRKLWLRGGGGWMSRLLRSTDGKMCCLGQLALQCGLTREQIADRTSLYTLQVELPEALRWLVSMRQGLLAGPTHSGTRTELRVNSVSAKRLMSINDRRLGEKPDRWESVNDDLLPTLRFETEVERESFLAAEFAEHDIEVEFVN